MMKQYLTLLIDFPVVRRLTWIQFIAYFGAWFSNVAIFTLLVELQVSATIIALIAALHFLPGVVQAPLTGVLIDRIAPKKLMLFLLAVEIVATLLLLFVTDVAHLWLLGSLVFIRMAGASFYFTVEMSLLPKILDETNLQKANTLHSMVWSLSYALGMAVSGLFVAVVGIYSAFVVDALLFIIALFLLLTLHIEAKPQTEQGHFFREFLDGISYLKNEPKILLLLILHAFVGFTALDALVVLLAQHHYVAWIAVPLAIGMIHVIRAVALVVGPMLFSNYVKKENLVYLFIFQAIMFSLWAIDIENFYYSLTLSFFVGLAMTTLWSFTYTLIQINTDEKFYGRVISYNDMLFLFISGMTSLGIGWLYDAGVSLAQISLIFGAIFIFGALYFLWLKERYLDD